MQVAYSLGDLGCASSDKKVVVFLTETSPRTAVHLSEDSESELKSHYKLNLVCPIIGDWLTVTLTDSTAAPTVSDKRKEQKLGQLSFPNSKVIYSRLQVWRKMILPASPSCVFLHVSLNVV